MLGFISSFSEHIFKGKYSNVWFQNRLKDRGLEPDPVSVKQF